MDKQRKIIFNSDLQKHSTDFRGRHKGISYVIREHHAKTDELWKHRSITFGISIELKYISSKYKSLWLNKEKVSGYLKLKDYYPHMDLECFFAEPFSKRYSFRTEFGKYELTSYSKLSGFEDGGDKIVEIGFSSDTCWDGQGYVDSTFTVEQVFEAVKQTIDAFLRNVPEYSERMQELNVIIGEDK